MIPTFHTIDDLKADHDLLRRVCGEVLNPPDPATGSWAEIADQLREVVQKSDPARLKFAKAALCLAVLRISFDPIKALQFAMSWWFHAAALDRVLCCLLALNKARMP